VLGQSPQTRDQLTGHGHDDLLRMCAPGAERSIACAQPGLGIPGLRETSLAAALAPGRYRRRQAQVMPAWSRVIHAGQVHKCGEARDRPRQRPATEGLERFDDGREPPGIAVCVACWCQPLEPCGVCGHRPHLCLHDALVRGGGTHDLAEPAPVRWAPGGPAGRPEIMSSHTGCEATLGRLQSVARLVTRTTQVTHGIVFDVGDIDRGAIPGAPQPSPWEGIPTSGVDTVARRLWDQGGGDDPAVVAGLGQIAGAPGPTGARFIDEDQVCGG
jgi:hypothetical protein